ncbi:Transporter [Planctomycetales bacterium 10988]|nr:Transporter [Planctomycetales bacterium 10988]
MLHERPELVLFLVLALGYLLGKITIYGFQIGSTAGVLFAGLLFGYWGYTGPPFVDTLGFYLFIYTVGFQAGPRFLNVFLQDGFRYMTLAFVVAGTGLGIAFTISLFFGFEPGVSAGVLAGALTSTPTLAAAKDTVQRGLITLPEGMTAEQIQTNISTSYAISYLFGLAGVQIIILLLPKIAGVNLAKDAEEMEASTKQGTVEPAFGIQELVVRAYQVENPALTKQPLAKLYDNTSSQFTIQRVKRNGELITVNGDTKLEYGDIVAVTGLVRFWMRDASQIGKEVFDPEVLVLPTESCEMVVTKKDFVGMTLAEVGILERFGCFLSQLRRVGVRIPLSTNLRLERGDVLSITGTKQNLERLSDYLGHIERESDKTDLLTMALAIGAGILIGSLTFPVGKIQLGLGTAGGTLLMGILVGHMRSIRPTFGRIPPPTRWLLIELGMALFMAMVGLRAGIGFFPMLDSVGFPLMISACLVTSVPIVVGYLFGRWFLQIPPVILLGAITGSMTSTPALKVVTDQARSPLPALGYTGAYVFANLLVTIAGTMIVRI